MCKQRINPQIINTVYKLYCITGDITACGQGDYPHPPHTNCQAKSKDSLCIIKISFTIITSYTGIWLHNHQNFYSQNKNL